MSLRPRTVRRLTILLAACVLLVGTIVALYVHNEHKKAARLAESRETGMTAYKSGDYQATLDSLKYYVARVKNDTDALYAYGDARSRIETPNRSHIGEGINVFNAILQVDPTHLPAKHRLLDLYTQAGYDSEAVDLATRILSHDTNDKDATRAKATALYRLRKYEDALLVSEEYNELDPNDLEQQLLTYRIMRSLKRPDAQLLARAQRQQKEHPNDPRFELLLGWVYADMGDMPSCMQWLNTAAARPAPDAEYVKKMVFVLDQLRLYDQSQTLLDRAVAQNPDPAIGRVLIQRLWQNAKSREVLDRLKALDENAADADSGLLAYKALALFETGQRDAANKIVAKLAERKTDSEAMAWATALGTRFGKGDTKAALAQYQAALVRSPDNAVIRYLIGEAQMRLGEMELAINAWRRVTEVAPSWPTPHLELARALAASGRMKDAVAEAYLAYRAAPDQPATITTLISVRYKALEEGQGGAADEKSLFALVEELQKRVPGEPETLPVYVNLLARAGRKDDAALAVTSALNRGKKYETGTILALGKASRTYGLGLEEQLQHAGGSDESNPRIAFARAADLAASGKPQDGLTLIQDRAKAATTQPVQWRLAVTQYKELIREPAASKEWIALGDAHPNDLAVQLSILKTATAARPDRDFIARTIERVRNLTGPEAQTWKLERARWLLGSDSSKDAAEAVNTLTDIVRMSPNQNDARLLLAAAYEKVDKLPQATKELQAAADRDPGREAILVEIARLLQAQNKFDEARSCLERAAAANDVTPETRRRVCSMLTAQAEFGRAAKILESAKELDTPSILLLADIYRRQGRTADAEAAYSKLLALAPLDVEVVRVAADFYASIQKNDQATKVLSRLPEAKPRPGVTELITAAFNEKWGSPDIARRQYTSATAVAPSDPTPWRQLIIFHLRGGRYDDARQAADDALKSLPNEESIKNLAAVALNLAKLSEAAGLRPVVNVLGSSPEDRGVIGVLARGSDATSQPTAQNLLDLIKAAQPRHPRSLPLRMAEIQYYVAVRQFTEAADAAAKTMESFPSDPDSARIACTVYRMSGKWDLAASAAKRWRERTPDRPAPADWALAEIDLARGDATGAIKTLGPYVQQVTSNPQGNPPVLAILMRAYLKAGRENDAKAALEPLLPKDRNWRLLWLNLAGEEITSEKIASQWIAHVTPLLADDAEHVALGQAWYNIAARLDSSDALTAAAKAVDPIVARNDASADIVLLRAAIADRAGDAAMSQQLYRRGVELNPKHAGALNNLAYLILQAGGDINEAKTLANKAVELSPANASFYDTLARVQAKAGERDAAVASFEKALKLDPTSIEAMIGMAATLNDAGKGESAAKLLSQINTLLKGRPQLSPQLQRELDALRATVKASL